MTPSRLLTADVQTLVSAAMHTYPDQMTVFVIQCLSYLFVIDDVPAFILTIIHHIISWGDHHAE
jgi:hypothetical protein